MPRVARKAPGGLVYHVLNRGAGRMTLFRSDEDYLAFLRCLAAALEACPGVRLIAYCLMPNHWHLLLWPTRDGELARFMQRLTITHVRRWVEHRRRRGYGSVYQGRYKSFPVQGDGHLLAVARYAERNALRAKLVRRAQDWRWSSLGQRHLPGGRDAGGHDAAGGAKGAGGAQGAEGREDHPRIALSPGPVPRPADWLAWVNAPQTPAEVAAIREAARRGRPYGAPPWVAKTQARLGIPAPGRRGRPPKRRA